MEEWSEGFVLDLIDAAVMAGAYSTLARQMPEAERGLEKMRAKWSGRVTALADEFCRTSGERLIALAELPVPHRNR